MLGKNGSIYWTQVQGYTSIYHIYQLLQKIDADVKNVPLLLAVTEESEFMLKSKPLLKQPVLLRKKKG